MFKRLIDVLESLPLTLVGGVCLLISLFIPDLPIHLNPAWITLLISGVPLLCTALRKLIHNKGISKISSALLITIAMFAAVAIGDLFAAGEVAFIMAIGEMLEDKTTARAKKGLKQLISLSPTTGRRIKDGKEEIVAAEDIAVGDMLRILPGETVPVDGIITDGNTSIDQSVITGESLPVDKSVGDSVFCGTVNRFGAVDIKACKVGKDSSLQKLIRMVKEAEEKKAPIQRTADRWASLLVPLALLLAVAAGLIRQDIEVAVTVLVVFCPCALVLATPTAIMAAIGQAAKHGVIIKSGEALETLGKISTAAFDKTGTLTYGKLELCDIISLDGEKNETELLTVTASAESKSEHPLGKAVVAEAKRRGLTIYEAKNFNMQAGMGVSATVNGVKLYCGNERLLTEAGINAQSEKVKELKAQGKALIYVADETKLLGIIALSDAVKEESAAMLKRLKENGTQTVLLTGDSEEAAAYFANKTGINKVYARLLPEEKVASLEALKENGERVCMIGDGVNDAPALKCAHVGIAMGSAGSDIAVEAADVAIMGDDVNKIPYLLRLAKETVKTVRFSIATSLLINFLAIALSFFKLLNPTTGALVHNGGSLLVILFAASLYNRKF